MMAFKYSEIGIYQHDVHMSWQHFIAFVRFEGSMNMKYFQTTFNGKLRKIYLKKHQSQYCFTTCDSVALNYHPKIRTLFAAVIYGNEKRINIRNWGNFTPFAATTNLLYPFAWSLFWNSCGRE